MVLLSQSGAGLGCDDPSDELGWGWGCGESLYIVLLTYAAVSHQGATRKLRLHFSAVVAHT